MISDATSGNTIQVQKNITDTTQTTFSKSITLDTNGKTITRNAGAIVPQSGTLTINGSGTIKFTSGNLVASGGSITLNGGTISFTTGYLSAAGGNVTIAGATVTKSGAGFTARTLTSRTLTLNSGTIKSTSTSTTANGAIGNAGTFTMNGGTVSSTAKYTIYNNYNSSLSTNPASLNLYKGTVTNSNSSGYTINQYSNSGSSYSCTGHVYIGNSSTTYSETNIVVSTTNASGYVFTTSGPCTTWYLYNGKLTSASTATSGNILWATSGPSVRSGYTGQRSGSSGNWTYKLVASKSGTNSTGDTSTTSTKSKASLNASDINYDNSQTGLECTEAQCALDKIKELIGEDSNEEK